MSLAESTTGTFSSRIQKLDSSGVMTTVIEDSGSNGLIVDSKNNLIAGTHKYKSVSRYSLPTSTQVSKRSSVAEKYNGNVFNSPNDLAITKDGTLYFTDPDFQRSAAPGGQQKTRVYRVATNGKISVVDELPQQFQIRDFKVSFSLKPNESRTFTYTLNPRQRGIFVFGKTHVFVGSLLGFINRRFSFGENVDVPVYPSFVQMRKYELLALSNRMDPNGVKKVRKPGKHTEFDQVRDYTTGDDYRLINWKATAKLARPMINQYQEELAKDVYSLIDLGRVMKQPFGQMTLLDYSINASLALSNIALLKHDKAGLITFSTKIDTFIRSDRRNNQLNSIMEGLYCQNTGFPESNYDLLYLTIKKQIRHRSLLILYSNFESMVSLRRHIPPLQSIARNHLVLVVMFENTEIPSLAKSAVNTLEDAYISTIAEKFIFEKKQMVRELSRHGINALITQPGNLTTNLLNKYLEFKSRELI